MTKIVFVDNELRSKFQTVICDTIIDSKNRNDLFVLMGELATACALYTQNNLLSNNNVSSTFKNPEPAEIEKVVKSAMFGRPHREKVNLAEKLMDTHFADAGKMVEPDNLEIPNDHVADTGKTIDPDQITPVWISENINLAEYWVYDYSTPATTLHGECGHKCVKTELWLIERRTNKLIFVDAEFLSIDALHAYLDPLKALTKSENISPLEMLDAEIDGEKPEKKAAKLRTAQKISKFNRFIECYHIHNGDPEKIAQALEISKDYVYTLKNKAKNKGLIK